MPSWIGTKNPTHLLILECSTDGDTRFSAFCAKVSVFGVVDTIENHYQKSKVVLRFGSVGSKYTVAGKGVRPHCMFLDGHSFPIKYLTPFYKLLWCKYLDLNPELVAYASQFDDYSDKFKGKSFNCQADVIREYIKQGRGSIYDDPLVRDFVDICKTINSRSHA